MPLEDLFEDDIEEEKGDGAQRELCRRFGVQANPFPSAAQTSGHPHLPVSADSKVDRAVKAFIGTPNSYALAITSSQGIGKTNLLNAYETALQAKLRDRGFFVIRYVADPEPSFDPLVRSIFEHLGEDHLKRVISAASQESKKGVAEAYLQRVRLPDMKNMLESLIGTKTNYDSEDFDYAIELAQQWLLGLPVRKVHREGLGVNFRLDTVESKTRALRELVLFSATLDELRGIFILLDELEKQAGSLSKTVVLRYLSALRALIDALPEYLFLMVALTTDALQRYREMLPALKGRLANEVELQPIRDEDEALKYWRFYIDEARKAAKDAAEANGWECGNTDIVDEDEALNVFASLRKKSSIEGVRQRDFLNELNSLAMR
ncbi:MAG: hypothetical protein JRJ11_12430 [Deltaproteobacteria bacterium]|nr:hypothetical protein [Deltaproteobacteria bacterium]MBW1910329.1 hypothetical protein [Deltaproteobacteria bacterium]MBW2034562.1 hypothetical protein [Deltaproteobacteria bacterium]MBW2115232.1 hypothetical protein [Deltaproteobacteria bacterium]MBW2168414.1 hypothetical protein [Deltaproteobacteria bacterium]